MLSVDEDVVVDGLTVGVASLLGSVRPFGETLRRTLRFLKIPASPAFILGKLLEVIPHTNIHSFFKLPKSAAMILQDGADPAGSAYSVEVTAIFSSCAAWDMDERDEGTDVKVDSKLDADLRLRKNADLKFVLCSLFFTASKYTSYQPL